VAQSFYLREQAERCRRLARDSSDPGVRDGFLKLADEYVAKADALENDQAAVWQASSSDDGTT
jgi:hypothetical protein